MGLFDTYRTRINGQGDSFSGSIEQQTITFINNSFPDSPFYRNILVDGTSTETRVLRTQDPHTKNLLFRPSTLINKGALIQIDNDYWLTTSFEPNSMYPKATINQCNEMLRWYHSDGTLKQQHCVVLSLHRKVDLRVDSLMEMGDYQIRVLVQKNSDTNLLIPSLRFILGGQAYQMLGIDKVSNIFDGVGYYDIGVEVTTTTNKDDLTNEIADNSLLWGNPTNVTTPNGGSEFKW